MAWGISGTGRLTEPYYRLKHGHDQAPSPRYREKNAAGTVSDITSTDWDTAPTNGTLVEEWTGSSTASAPSWAQDMWSGSTIYINGHSIVARRYVIATSSTTTDDVEVLISNTSDFNQFIWHGEHSGSGTVQYSLTLDGKQYGNIYTSTFQEDNASAVDQDGQNGINVSPTAPAVAEHTFMVGYACHTGDEKLCIADHNFSTGTGAGSIPSKASVVGKTTDTSTIDNISVVNLTTGSDFTNSSKLSVFGSDLTLNATAIDFTNVQLGSRLEETDTRKMYDYGDHPTFEDNTFSSGWTSTDSTNVNTNTTTKVIDANVPSTGAQTGVLTYPLGYTLENNFVLEFKMEITSYTDNTDNTHQEIYIGMTNNTSAYNVSQQFIGMSISNAGTGGGNDRYALQEFYNEALTANNGQGDSTNRPNANDIRYHRISKSGSTLTYSIYSDSSYSTLVETISGTATDTYSLNTISVKLRALDGTQNGVLTVEIDDIKIYNGVGTPSNSWKEIGA